MTKDKFHIEELKNKLAHKKNIEVDDFYSFYHSIYGDITKNRVRWYIYKLKEKGIIRNISRGIYIFEEEKEIENEYAVITLDIIDSSKEDHNIFDNKLKEKVQEINKFLQSSIGLYRKYHISQGDEIQLLCPFDDRIAKILILTFAVLKPYKCRFALSIGRVEEGDMKENSWDMNGPIFWNARDVLKEMKKSKDYDGVFASGYENVDKIINKFMKSVLVLINKISAKQWEAVLEQMTKQDLKEAAESLNISLSSLYDRINSSNISQIVDSIEALIELIQIRRKLL